MHRNAYDDRPEADLDRRCLIYDGKPEAVLDYRCLIYDGKPETDLDRRCFTRPMHTPFDPSNKNIWDRIYQFITCKRIVQ